MLSEDRKIPTLEFRVLLYSPETVDLRVGIFLLTLYINAKFIPPSQLYREDYCFLKIEWKQKKKNSENTLKVKLFWYKHVHFCFNKSKRRKGPKPLTWVVDLIVSEDFFIFFIRSLWKKMTPPWSCQLGPLKDHQGMTNLNPTGMVGRIY